MIPVKKKWAIINPWPMITAYLYGELLSLLLWIKKITIQSQFTRAGLSLRSMSDVVTYIKSRIDKIKYD